MGDNVSAPTVTPDLFRGPGLPRTPFRGKPGKAMPDSLDPRNKSGVTVWKQSDRGR